MPAVTRVGGRGDGAAVDDGSWCRRRADAAAPSSRERDLGGRGPKRRVLRQADGGRARMSLSWLADTRLSQDRATPIRFCRPTTPGRWRKPHHRRNLHPHETRLLDLSRNLTSRMLSRPPSLRRRRAKGRRFGLRALCLLKSGTTSEPGSYPNSGPAKTSTWESSLRERRCGAGGQPGDGTPPGGDRPGAGRASAG